MTVALYRVLESEVQGLGNQRVADAHLIEVGHVLGKKLQVLRTQIMACIDA